MAGKLLCVFLLFCVLCMIRCKRAIGWGFGRIPQASNGRLLTGGLSGVSYGWLLISQSSQRPFFAETMNGRQVILWMNKLNIRPPPTL